MKTIAFIGAVFLLGNAACTGQKESKQNSLYNPEFKWSIVIPGNFDSVSPEDWARLQNKGTDAIEQTYGAEVVNQTKTIFVFKSGESNYLEANFQPFDPSVDGSYHESNKQVKAILYETFSTQIPNAKIDTLSSIEKVDGLEFNRFKVFIDMPNGVKFTTLLYSRLFDKKEFSLNIMYIDEEKGKRMLESWHQSTFD